MVILPFAIAAVAFGALFWGPAAGLLGEWFQFEGDNGQGVLLAPVAAWLAWTSGVREDARPSVGWGTALLFIALVFRIFGALAAELFTQRLSIWIALLGLVVFYLGWRQVRMWWLPFTLLFLSIPLPALITNRLAIPLQFQASKMGAALMTWRKIPVVMTGNVIDILPSQAGPGQRLFVAEACSGLRSMSALLALGVMLAGMYMRTLPTRILIVLLALPVAVVVNGFRVFLTGFLMHYVDPKLGAGFAHEGQGWLLFMVAFGMLAAIGAVLRYGETLVARKRGVAHA